MSLIFIVADSLRHDALGCFGGAARTPTADNLARGSVCFHRVISAAPWTVPSLASIFSGLSCHRMGLVRWDQPWPAAAPSLFRRARRSGYRVASFVFDPAFLLSQVAEAGVQGSSQDEEAVLGWLRRHRREQFLLFIHYWWTHVPYLDTPTDSAAWEEGARVVVRAVASGAEARQGVKRLYRRAVERFSERWLPRVLEAADLDRTWLVLTADHGESWAERPGSPAPASVFDLHGNTLHDEVLRVPLLIRSPGGGPHHAVPELIRTVDILPTLTDLLGLELGEQQHEMDGCSLAGVVQGGGPPPRLEAYSARNRDFTTASRLPDDPAELWRAFGLTTPRYKLIWEQGTERRRAFDLDQDPGETRDISGQDLPELEQGWRRLERQAARARVGPPPAGGPVEIERRMRELGYT